MAQLFRVKEGKLNQWKKWCDYLVAHKSEVIDSLKEEKVTRELSVLYGEVVFYVMVGECLPSTDTELNRMHKKNLAECLEEVRGDVLFDFSVE